MTTFGVHSEVGRLRKVMVHRPELSLQRLTPSNHDDLLFDDVLWVERAQREHDQFVAAMRERGVEVFILRDLLAETLAASDDARQRLIELAASEFTVGISMAFSSMARVFACHFGSSFERSATGLAAIAAVDAKASRTAAKRIIKWSPLKPDARLPGRAVKFGRCRGLPRDTRRCAFLRGG